MKLTKKELEEVKANALLIKDGKSTYYGVEFVLNQLISEAPESHWKNYPEVRPEKDGDYLVKFSDMSGIQESTFEDGKFIVSNVIAFCELPQ